MKLRPATGLTLVEVLVVLVMITVMTSLAIGSVRFGANTDSEIDRLALVLDQASERARVRGAPLRFEVLPHGYRFSMLDTSGIWQTVSGDAVLAERNLPVDMSLEHVRRDNQDVGQTLIFGSDVTLFSIVGKTANGAFTLAGLASGSVVRLKPEEVSGE